LIVKTAVDEDSAVRGQREREREDQESWEEIGRRWSPRSTKADLTRVEKAWSGNPLDSQLCSGSNEEWGREKVREPHQYLHQQGQWQDSFLLTLETPVDLFKTRKRERERETERERGRQRDRERDRERQRERERQETFLKDGAAFAATNLPVAVPPVKEIAATSGWDTSEEPTSPPSPWTIFKTPSGKPALLVAWANKEAVVGVISDGFATIVQPAASAGAIYHWVWGKEKGQTRERPSNSRDRAEGSMG
jgi:hypothetical protein